MVDIEKFKRHLGKTYTAKIGDDTFELPPIPMELTGDFFDLTGKFQDDKNALMRKENVAIMARILKKLIEIQYPELDEKIREEFVMNNFLGLSVAVLENNTFGADTSHEAIKKAEALRRLKNDKSAVENKEKTSG